MYNKDNKCKYKIAFLSTKYNTLFYAQELILKLL